MNARGYGVLALALLIVCGLPSGAAAFDVPVGSVTKVYTPPVVPPGVITFEPRPYVINGLQGDFRVVDKAVIGPLKPHGVRVALLVTNGPDNALKARLLVVDLGPKAGKVVQSVFEKPTDPFGLAEGQVTAADIDHDGHKELFVVGSKPEQTSGYRLVGGTYERMKVPFPKLYGTKLVWLDYNGDGWADLFLSGAQRSQAGVYMAGEGLFRNDHGKLVLERRILPSDYMLSSAEAVDLDGDGAPDLVVFPRAGYPHRRPLPTLLFLSRGGQLVADPNPFGGFDDMIGLGGIGRGGGHVACADINGNGKREVLMSGVLYYDLGVDSAKSILYQLCPSQGEDLYYQYDWDDQIPDIYGAWTLADLNGDGHVDAFGWGAKSSHQGNLVCLYNEDGHLVPLDFDHWCHGSWGGPLDATVVLPYDLDGDGRLDFLLLDTMKPTVTTTTMNVLTRQVTVTHSAGGEIALLHNTSALTH